MIQILGAGLSERPTNETGLERQSEAEHDSAEDSTVDEAANTGDLGLVQQSCMI